MLVATAFPSWTPHPDVWLLVGLFAAGYAIAIVRLGPRWGVPGQAVVTRFQITCWSLGVLAMWAASDYPIHDVAERYNYSVHMAQHLMFSMLVAPLLLLGTPAWLLRGLLRPPALFRVVRTLARFVPALVIFNVVLVVTHWPVMVNASLHSALVHFSLHAVLFVSSLIVWLPIVSPLPEIPRLVPVVRMLYLFAWSVVPTVPASFLTFGSTPLYSFYEHVPHLYGLSTLQDQQLAGLIMKIGAGLLLWMIIAVVFFRWASEEERANTPRHGLDELDRELTQMGLRR
ncbi:MAG TPA: cytochrome c oxidase assembly protein [Acidimicrobiia bacterium]